MKVGDTIYGVRMDGETPKFTEYTIVRRGKVRMTVEECGGWSLGTHLDILPIVHNGYEYKGWDGAFALTKEAAINGLMKNIERSRAIYRSKVIVCGRQIKALKAELRKELTQ